jgi:hypothetical protein
MIPGVLEFVAFLLKHTCGIFWNMREWRFRTFLDIDIYIVHIGMITSMLFHRTSRLSSGSLTPNSIINGVLQLTITQHGLFRAVTIIVSLSLLPGFWLLTRRYPNKEDYNWWQPYISLSQSYPSSPSATPTACSELPLWDIRLARSLLTRDIRSAISHLACWEHNWTTAPRSFEPLGRSCDLDADLPLDQLGDGGCDSRVDKLDRAW